MSEVFNVSYAYIAIIARLINTIWKKSEWLEDDFDDCINGMLNGHVV